MKKWLKIDQYKKIFKFLGNRVLKFFACGVLIGTILFLVEIVFAFSIQEFLVTIGAMKSETAQLPSWLPKLDFNEVLIVIIFVGALRGFLQASQLFLQGIVVEAFTHMQRSRILRWALHSDSVSTPEVMSLAYEQTEAGAAVCMNLMSLSVQLTTGLLLFFSMMSISPLLTLSACVILGVLSLPLQFTNNKIKTAGQSISNEWNRTNRLLLMSIKNLLLMQAYGTQSLEEKKIKNSLDEFYKYSVSYQFLSSLKFAVPQILGVSVICTLSLIGKLKFQMEPGLLISYFYLFVRFLQSYSSLNFSLSHLSRFWNRSLALSKWWADHSLDGYRNIKNIDEPTSINFDVQGATGWKIKNVSFQYPGTNNNVISNFSSYIEPGSILVITGASGTGKSTLLHLFLGLLSPSNGEITLKVANQEYDLKNNRIKLLRNIGYVGPESFVLEGTIYQNLCYGLETTPTASEIETALELAECQFINQLPFKLQHILSEQGSGLSAGQKQRISLARALLRKPRALVLDEATSNLDINTEKKLIETFSKLKGSITIIAVTHRLPLLEIADQKIHLSEQ